METLLELTAVNEVHETKKLRELYNNIEINMRSLEALDIESSGPTNPIPKFDQHKGRVQTPFPESALYTGSEECTLQCIFCKKSQVRYL